jgi:hypothetical protein
MSNESENEKKNAALYEQIKKENREELTAAIDLLNSHTVMVSLIRVAKPAGIKQLTQEEKKPLRDALALLCKIRNNMDIAEDVKAGHVVLGVNAPYTES